MAYETKALLAALAEIAILRGSKDMYQSIAKIANTEGVVLKSYETAKAELNAANDKVASKSG